MLTVTDAGGNVFPPFPSISQGLPTFDEMIRQTSRGISLLDIDVNVEEWPGITDESK